MDAILAKRNLAKERNTAQMAIDEKIQQMAVNARETEFSIPQRPISGDINVSKLSSLNVTSIITREGGAITEVVGIPNGVKNLKIEKHLLVDAPQLPKSIETLNLDGNYIESVDLSNAKNLKVVRLNGNRLNILKDLPESLEELYVDNNKIKRLDLGGLPNLRVLHCRNNHTIRIENIPASIIDLQVEEGNPHIMLDYDFLPTSVASEEGSRAKGTELEFTESLHDYFKLKNTYEEDAIDSRHTIRKKALLRGMGEKTARKIANQLRPKCVNCKRPVGTVFKTRKDRFLAYCGDVRTPCALRIEIYKGRFESDDVFAEYTRNSLLDTKEQIIRQKMDVLFNYASEEETVSKFKDLIEDYNLLSFLHKTDLDMREEKRFNIHKRELIKAKLKLLNELKMSMNVHMEEYKQSGNRESIHTAMDIYVREYMPAVNNLRMLKYNVMEMLTPLSVTDEPTIVRKLNQSAASLRQLETLHGEVPRVLKFTLGNAEPTASISDRTPEDESIAAEEEVIVPFESEEDEWTTAE